MLEKLRDISAKIVNESKLPIEAFNTSVGIYGGKLKSEDGKLIYDMRGTISKLDKAGDKILRAFDDNLLKKPLQLLYKHPKLFLNFLFPTTKRYRGNNKEIYENIKNIGIEEDYGIHPHGIEIKNQELYKKGIPLQDIYRSEEINSDLLKGIDRNQGLKAAIIYINILHERSAIGELLTNDIIFQEVNEGSVSSPKLNIPDILYNKNVDISEKEKRAIDILDFFMHVGIEEFRRTENWDNVKNAFNIIKDTYNYKRILDLVKSYIKRGRLTLNGDKKILNLPNSLTYKIRGIFTKHNEARLGIDDNYKMEAQLKKILLDVL